MMEIEIHGAWSLNAAAQSMFNSACYPLFPPFSVDSYLLSPLNACSVFGVPWPNKQEMGCSVLWGICPVV